MQGQPSTIAAAAVLQVAIAMPSLGETTGESADRDISPPSAARELHRRLDAFVLEVGLDAAMLAERLGLETKAPAQQSPSRAFCDVHQRYESTAVRQHK